MSVSKTKPEGSGAPSGSKTVQKLRRQYLFLRLLQAPSRWAFWTIQQHLDRLETERLRQGGGHD